MPLRPFGTAREPLGWLIIRGVASALRTRQKPYRAKGDSIRDDRREYQECAPTAFFHFFAASFLLTRTSARTLFRRFDLRAGPFDRLKHFKLVLYDVVDG